MSCVATTPLGLLFVLLTAFAAGFGWSAGNWLRVKVLK
jgi:hypothetical protein